jgi:hypothetical protein
VRVPVVLDLVVRALGQVRRDRRPPAHTREESVSAIFLPTALLFSHGDRVVSGNVTHKCTYNTVKKG